MIVCEQHWFMSFRNTGRVTDEERHRAFALVNRSTWKALKLYGLEKPVRLVFTLLALLATRTLGARDAGIVLMLQVELAGHSPDSVNVAQLWTRSDDVGEGFHFIRAVSDVRQVLDAAEAVPECGGAHDGTPIIVFPWNGGLNQRWTILPLH
ncbi:hypothetical protein ABZP36_018720 [Zizania latifolia]